MGVVMSKRNSGLAVLSRWLPSGWAKKKNVRGLDEIQSEQVEMMVAVAASHPLTDDVASSTQVLPTGDSESTSLNLQSEALGVSTAPGGMREQPTEQVRAWYLDARVLQALAVTGGGFLASALAGSGGESGTTTEPSGAQTTDEQAPVFKAPSANTEVVKSTDENQVVYVAQATDDSGAVTYALSGKDADKLRINSQSGQVRLTPEALASDQVDYSFDVTASDAAGNQATQRAGFTVVIDDTRPPEFVSSPQATMLTENTGANQWVYTALALDYVDVTEYLLSGRDAAKLSIDKINGEVRLLANPDYETQSEYVFDVIAKDAAGNAATLAVSLRIADVDDTRPVITSLSTASVLENSGANQWVYTVVASDNVQVSAYALSGVDAAKLSVNASNGEVRLLANPDYESQARYDFTVVARDGAGNSASQNVALLVRDVDDASPVIVSLASAGTITENSGANQWVYTIQAQDNVAVTTYGISGFDASAFSVNASNGQVRLNANPDYELKSQYRFDVWVVDAAGNQTTKSVNLGVSDVAENTTLPDDVTALWQVAELSSSAGDVNALQAYSALIASTHANTDAMGTANGRNAQAQYITQVTGTDVVSRAEYAAGFSVAGHAQAGLSGQIKFYLDADRTNGVAQMGAQLVDGVGGVHIQYNNTTGDYVLSFDANSSVLQPAAHNQYGSGVHQLTVDSNGNGVKDSAEASRLFLVANGTAQSTDTGAVSQNFSVHDAVTNQIFVYYYGDPDGQGVSMWTLLDSGESAPPDENQLTPDQDLDGLGLNDWDYYQTSGVALGTQATAMNTAVHLVTDIPAQIWELHLDTFNDRASWTEAQDIAGDHTVFGSNTSRLPALDELLAVYAANFGGETRGWDWLPESYVVGAVQPLSNEVLNTLYVDNQDNIPGGWEGDAWSAAPTPSGHARVNFGEVHILDAANDIGIYGFNVVAVL